jgi:arsenate reductase-like glutaredoxin family protein
MKIYGLKACDTCRKALKAMIAAGRDVSLVDVREEPLSAQDLSRFHTAFGAALINTRSTTWRGLSEDDRALPAIELLGAHPAVMKRPVIDADGVLYLGWDAAVRTALL